MSRQAHTIVSVAYLATSSVYDYVIDQELKDRVR